MLKLDYDTKEQIAKLLHESYCELLEDEETGEAIPSWEDLDDEDQNDDLEVVEQILALINGARRRKPPQFNKSE